MSTELPANPDLGYLKKQAKGLLQDFRQKDPQAVQKFSTLQLKATPKLSDAQHLVAREYGFDSWSKLKKHVDGTLPCRGKAAQRLLASR